MPEYAYPEFENKLKVLTRQPEPHPAFISNLRAQIVSTAAVQPAPRARLSLRPSWIVVLVLVGILLAAGLIVGPQNVLGAVRNLLGYVPGIGFVDESGLRVLVEPVTVEREDITLTVEQAVLDGQRTVIVYKVEGLSLVAANSQGESALTGSSALLQRPDGPLLQQEGGEFNGWASGYQAHLTFSAFPAEFDRATLIIPRLQTMPAGAAPEDWRVTLEFQPAPEDFEVAPVIEFDPAVTAMPTATVVPQGDQSQPTEIEPENATPYGIVLTLDKAAELEDGYILTGTLDWQNVTPPAQFVSMASWMTLTDVNGATVPIEPSSTSLDSPSPETKQKETWAYQVAGKHHPGPLTLTLDNVAFLLEATATFQFDAGEAPEIGQFWEMDQELEVNGYALHLISVEAVEHRNLPGYKFSFESDPQLTSITLVDPGNSVAMAGGGTIGQMSATVLYAEGLPSGMHTLKFENITARVEGPWQTTWTPPAPDASAPTPTAMPQVCLTLDSWNALPEDQLLPANLSGKLVGYGVVAEPDTYGIFTVNLDGSDRQEVGSGTWPRLSPDGNFVAYSGEQGLYLADLREDTTTLIPNTNASDYNPHWSPDRERIAFVRVDDLNLYTIKPDGSDLRQITSGVEYELLIGWSPNGKMLYFAPPAEGGFRFKSIEVTSGTLTEYDLIGGERAAVSSDGQWLAFQDKVFGEFNRGLFVSRLDGSQRQPIAQFEHWGVGDPIWSPDGNWVLAIIYDTDQMDKAGHALINPATCQVIRLPYLHGYIYSWVP